MTWNKKHRNRTYKVKRPNWIKHSQFHSFNGIAWYIENALKKLG